MGKKEAQPPAKETNEEKAEEEDSPIVKQLKALDDKYLEIEREYEKEVSKLQAVYAARQKPLLEARAERLAKVEETPEAGSADAGTPALDDFWMTALQHHPAFEDKIEEWDAPVLKYLKNVTHTPLSEEDSNAGFKIDFTFVPNPYFTNDILTKTYCTKESCPWRGEIEAYEIKATTIDWKEGKDVTVEKSQKKVKGGGAKKAKQKAKETLQPRDSFFRHFFRSLSKDSEVPDDVSPEEAEILESGDPSEIVEMLMDNDLEIGNALKDSIIPFAVRWYTGEASPEDDDDEDDEEEEDEGDDTDDDDSDEDDDPKARLKGKGKGRGGKGGGKDKGDKGECKQQ